MKPVQVLTEPPGDFEPRVFTEELKRRSVRGGATLVLAQGGGHLIRLAMTVVLARLLTPADFGRVAIIASVIGIAQVFLDMGLSVVTAQRPKLTARQASTMFWLNVTFGAIVAAVCALAAPLIARFYDDPQTVPITLALAAGFFFNGLATQHRALLRRMLQFGQLARLNLLTVLCSAIVALAFALDGAGVWALVANALTADVVGGLLAWRYCRWRPGRPQLDRDILNILGHGGYIVGFAVMGYLGRNLHNVLIGRMFGSAAVGMFGRAIGFVNVLQSYTSSAIEAVALPALSQLRQDPVQYRNYYLKALRTAMLPAAALACFASSWAGTIVHALFGDQWTTASGLLTILATTLLVQPVLYSSGWLFLSNGRPRDMMRWGVAGWGVIIASIIVGSRYGLDGIAYAYAVGFAVLVVPNVAYAVRGTPVRTLDVLASWAPAVGAAILAGAATHLAYTPGESSHPIVQLGLFGTIYGAFYLAFLKVFGQWPLIMDILSHLHWRDRR